MMGVYSSITLILIYNNGNIHHRHHRQEGTNKEMTIGSRILEWRKVRGLTQAALAEKASMSPSAVAMYETNRRVPDQTALNKISAALGIPMALLSGETGEEASSSADQDKRTHQETGPEVTVQANRADVETEAADAVFSTNAEISAPLKPPSTTQLELTPEEAKIILFLRLNPASMAFFESYIRSDARQRDQLTRTWRLIHDFQRPAP